MSDLGAPINMAAIRAIAGRDPARAIEILKRAVALEPDNLGAWLNYAGLLRSTGRVDEALEAIIQALRVEPRSFHALLMRGSILESQDQFALAGRAYSLALLFAPRDGDLDPPTLAAVHRARDHYAKYSERFANEIADAVEAKSGSMEGKGRARFRQFVEMVGGKSKLYEQKPTDFHFPGLPAIAFYDDSVFPWLPKLEAAFPDILAELTTQISGGLKDFSPYVQLPVDVPVDQWVGLNHSPDWSSLFLKQAGHVVAENAPQFPKTLEALALIAQPETFNRSPVAMFSALQPHTRIPPHHGASNTRLVLHLPLIVPPGCGFRVGSETRQWVPGEAWVFDDTIEHEAWNDSEHLRIILIADVWSPFLTDDERRMHGILIHAIDEFHGEAASYSESL